MKECEWLENEWYTYRRRTAKHKSNDISLELLQKRFTRMTVVSNAVLHDRNDIGQHQPFIDTLRHLPLHQTHITSQQQLTCLCLRCYSALQNKILAVLLHHNIEIDKVQEKTDRNISA